MLLSFPSGKKEVGHREDHEQEKEQERYEEEEAAVHNVFFVHYRVAVGSTAWILRIWFPVFTSQTVTIRTKI